MSKDYEINEKDIDSMLRYLRIHEPENATPEKAIERLEQLMTDVHMLSHTNPELLSKLYDELTDKKKSKD